MSDINLKFIIFLQIVGDTVVDVEADGKTLSPEYTRDSKTEATTTTTTVDLIITK